MPRARSAPAASRGQAASPGPVWQPGPGPGRLGDADLHDFNEGTHGRLYDRLGCHLRGAGQTGAGFAVWAPAARGVAVVGDFNGWDGGTHPLRARASSGVWEGFVPDARRGQCYKYRITAADGSVVEKADPFAFLAEEPPRTASRVWDLGHAWQDDAWMRDRGRRNARDAPMSIYEVHLGSWRRVPEEGNRSLTYREAAPLLAEHALAHGFTHIELLPVMEHPFAGSWGYQVTGYFAPTARFGTPQDLMFLVDHLHQRGVAVILDWVPAHFPNDAHGLARFDGTHLYEHADPRQGFHPDWNTLIFNYGRLEVRSFLLSSALFWLDRYHVDGLRVDGVASMLYLDYSRKEGEWVPNQHGGRENLDAIDFLRQLNTAVYREHPGVQTFAEESTAWPMVSRPVEMGGLGFGYKWDLGWMHDTLRYFAKEPVHRRHHHGILAFHSVYAHNENFVLPLSHDECVHGKGSLLGKMPGDDWQRFANLRLLLAWQAATPGKKLLFMGGEFGQAREWDHDGSLDWHLADAPPHRGIAALVRDLNGLHQAEPALHQLDCDTAGFEWVDASDDLQGVYAFLRHGRDHDADILVVTNTTPVVRRGYRVGVPRAGTWRESLNTDSGHYGGSGVGNLGAVRSEPLPWHERPHSIELSLPPLALVFFRHDAGDGSPPDRPKARRAEGTSNP